MEFSLILKNILEIILLKISTFIEYSANYIYLHYTSPWHTFMLLKWENISRGLRD